MTHTKVHFLIFHNIELRKCSKFLKMLLRISGRWPLAIGSMLHFGSDLNSEYMAANVGVNSFFCHPLNTNLVIKIFNPVDIGFFSSSLYLTTIMFERYRKFLRGPCQVNNSFYLIYQNLAHYFVGPFSHFTLGSFSFIIWHGLFTEHNIFNTIFFLQIFLFLSYMFPCCKSHRA